MLVVARKVDESVVIGDVTVRVVGVRGRTVRLAIDAPDQIKIARLEVLEELRRRDASVQGLLAAHPEDEPPPEFVALLPAERTGETTRVYPRDCWPAAWRAARRLNRCPSRNEIIKEMQSDAGEP